MVMQQISGQVLDGSQRMEPLLTENARRVLEARYLKRNEAGDCIEGPRDLFDRVAGAIAEVELEYGATELERDAWRDRFYNLMSTGNFMPNSPTLMNAGREMGMLSACFVLPVRDSINEIFDSIKHTALIQKAGGGTGFAFDELRPTGDYIQSSGGTTSGPISFWRAFSEATNAIQQGAFRRGANMGMMYIHHPDILKFLHAKQDLSQFNNYNISIKVTDAWMQRYMDDPDSPHVVRNPRNGRSFLIPRDVDIWKYDVRSLIEIDTIDAFPDGDRRNYHTTPTMSAPLPDALAGKVYTKRDIWDYIVKNAWQTGEPGVVFIDRINETNPTPHVGRIEATNPCGEQPLLPYEACNLGSINLGNFVVDACTPQARIDWDALRMVVHIATRFLDNVIDANNYPLAEIEEVCKNNRKIGLGVMGFADALFRLNVPYNSDAGIEWGERFMQFINDEAHVYSERLARERGCFPNWKGSTWDTVHQRPMRNACTTTVAPTGTISIIANCSGGIEPLFSLAFFRNVLRGQKQGETPMVEVNQTFREVAARDGFLSDELFDRLATEGTLHHIDEVPEEIRRVFVCAHDITPAWHMKMQAAFQRHNDSSISKTINFPHAASVEDVDQIYRLAFSLDCKGVTVYRDGCREFQPMALKDADKKETKTDAAAPAEAKIEEAPMAEETAIKTATVEVEQVDPAPVATNGANGNGANGNGSGAKNGNGAGRNRVRELAKPVAEAAPEPAAEPVRRTIVPQVPRIEPQDLPEIVSGLRIRQMTPFGNMHVKITVDPHADRELEVFAQLGKGGDVANSDLEAICRLTSLWLRAGGTLKHVIKQLQGIGSSLQIPTRMGRIMSLGDGLAMALKKYTRARERFGLRALLLGEVNLAELDNPNAAGPRPPIVDHAPHAGMNDGGNGANGAGVSRAAADDAAKNAAAGILNEAERDALLGNDEPGADRLSEYDDEHDADADFDLRNDVDAVITADASTSAPMAGAATSTSGSAAPATNPTSSGGASPTAVAAPRLTNRDVAAHYVLKCPECESPLALQEGCRKCYDCGWAAC